MTVFEIGSFLAAKIKLLSYKVFFNRALNVPFLSTYFEGEMKINNGRVIIGKNFRVRRDSILNVNSGFIKIGDDVFLNRSVSINCHRSITIGSNTIFGENVLIYDHNHNFIDRTVVIKKQGFNSSDVIIGDNVWIGAGVIILSGTNIGDNCVIGAGSILKGNIPSNTIFYQKRESTMRDL